MTAICVFGESTTWGAWDLEKGGWVNRLQLSLAPKINYELEVYNLGISGQTSNDLLERFEVEAKARMPNVIIISTGGNDACFNKKKNSTNVSVNEFEENIEEIIKLAKKFTKDIVVLGLRKVDEKKSAPVYWEKDLFYTNNNMKIYNAIIKKVAEKQKVFYIEQFDWLEENELDDGLHPNAKGHEKIAEKIEDFLVRNKIINLK